MGELGPIPERQAVLQHAGRTTSDDILYRITHDLNAELRSLSQLSLWVGEDLVESGLTLPPEVAETITALQDRAQRLQNMLRDLTVYSRVGTGGGVFDGDWDALLDRVLDEVPEATCFAFDAHWAVAPQIAHLDLFHLMLALVSNAVLHHDKGHGKIAVTADKTARGIAITVTDNGPGIPPAEWAQLCGILTTGLPRSETLQSGMGLAIATRVAVTYRGALTLSTPTSGRGARITADLRVPARALN